jgi:hypothetical protein
MANPIALAALLSRMHTITCPYCRYKKQVQRSAKPVAFRVCPNCKKQFPDPLAKRKK